MNPNLSALSTSASLANDRAEDFNRRQTPSLQTWELAMRRGRGAAQLGQWRAALEQYQQGLAMAEALIDSASPALAVDDCVAALVVSHHNLSDLQADAGNLDLAAAHVGKAHEVVLGLLLQPTRGEAMHLAALKHCRETHAALLRYLDVHGSHPYIVRALQAGCLAFGPRTAPLH
nr:DUF2753 family protein [uncultured Rhodoferax sp.]